MVNKDQTPLKENCTMNANTSTSATEVAAPAQEVTTIALLDLNGKLSLKELAEKINELVAAQNKLSTNNVVARDRGPKSEKDMSEEDARRVMLGDLKDASHKVAAETLGLSYGQVYSARKGFTFKSIYKEMMAPK